MFLIYISELVGIFWRIDSAFLSSLAHPRAAQYQIENGPSLENELAIFCRCRCTKGRIKCPNGILFGINAMQSCPMFETPVLCCL